jgi:(S)-3,5-dihydroxyphenylglycine transaminase
MHVISQSKMIKKQLQIPANRLSAAFSNPKLDVMNFLNEVAMRFPQAISFAPGRPPENFFGLAHSLHFIEYFMRHGNTSSLRNSGVHGLDVLGQYGRTNGIIGEIIARLLANDEGIEVEAEDIVVTVGAQEAIVLCLCALCRNPDDVVLSINPTYIGLTGAACLLGIEHVGVPGGDEGIDLPALECIVEQLAQDRKTARILYLGSDYANPTGLTLSIATREKLLDAAHRLNLLLVEDSAYNYFCYGLESLPPLKSMAGGECVIFIGSFAKTIYPGLRVGFIAADQRVSYGGQQSVSLAHELSKLKSLLTVNTSPLMQALVGGLLLKHDYSLRNFVSQRVQALKSNRDAMLAALNMHLPPDYVCSQGISWNQPAGGFFVTLTLPAVVSNEDLLACAADHGVTWTPMSYFECQGQGSRQIRLSFSYVNPAEIHEGIAKLASWIRSWIDRLSQPGPVNNI